jgi:hypothetical protein
MGIKDKEIRYSDSDVKRALKSYAMDKAGRNVYNALINGPPDPK